MNALLAKIGQLAIFLICAQTLVHFRPKDSYEKYVKLLVSIMLLILLVEPIMDLLGKGNKGDFLERIHVYEQKLQEILISPQLEAEEIEVILQNITKQKVEEGAVYVQQQEAGSAGQPVRSVSEEGVTGEGQPVNSASEEGVTGEGQPVNSASEEGIAGEGKPVNSASEEGIAGEGQPVNSASEEGVTGEGQPVNSASEEGIAGEGKPVHSASVEKDTWTKQAAEEIEVQVEVEEIKEVKIGADYGKSAENH